ncbi:MAG: hypothetical protein COA79_13980 [Planctomycetota bacterium]|nr:MAG: hypothetical protein COA79_13980 [Planctomycetota bacterium]
MAVHNSKKASGKRKIALVYHYLNRLTSDGDTGGLPLQGPNVCFSVKKGGSSIKVGPTSAAFSPDGKYVYLTGYMWQRGGNKGSSDSFHVVMRIEYDKQDEPTVFVGHKKAAGGWGKGNDQLCVPTSVACDSKGRVYVADYVNNRIQVFSSDAKYLKTIPAKYPGALQVDPLNGEITVASFRATGCSYKVIKETKLDYRKLKPMLTKFGSFENLVKPISQLLPAISIGYKGGWISTNGQPLQMAIDFYHKEKPLWIVGRKMTVSVAEANWMGSGGIWSHLSGWAKRGIRIYTFQKEKWNVLKDFALTAVKKVKRVTPSSFSRQRLLVNPTDGKLFVIEEQTGAGKSFSTILKVDPNSGNISDYKLPHDCEDMLFDIDGLVYLKTDFEITRYDPKTWQQINWDYGVERKTIRFSTSGSDPAASAMSALPLPGKRPGWYHSSGFGISPKGHLAVICHVKHKDTKKSPKRAKDRYAVQGVSTKYEPSLYEGRSGTRVIMVFNKHGNLIRDDAAPGMTNADGISVDGDGSIYVMVASPRVLDGKRYFNKKSETIIKLKSKDVKFISANQEAPLPLSEGMKPKRKADLYKTSAGDTWVNGAEWFYGGVGYGGQGGSCTCWHARFKLDYFGRSFAPETRRFNVAVLDTKGNLIMRIGKYGNVDDGKPTDSSGGPKKTNSIGGDEVSLMHAAYVGIHSDRYLYIHDAGNGRILSVKLGYHQSASMRISDNPNYDKLIK